MIAKCHTRTAGIVAAVIAIVFASTVSALVPGASVQSEQSARAANIQAAPTHVISLPHWEADSLTSPVVATPVLAVEPAPEPLCAPGGTEYTVRAGDTLSVIAGLCGTTVDVLATANGLWSPYTIYPGDVLQRQGVKVVEPPVQQANVVFPSAGAANYGPGIETVIGFAMAQLGDWYVFGANGPDTWDCSSLTQQSFGAAGINLTRTTYTQINQGTPVSRANVQRGDLVFPSDGHVGIALDNGTMIHAPQSGEQVKIGPIYAFYAARRFF